MMISLIVRHETSHIVPQIDIYSDGTATRSGLERSEVAQFDQVITLLLVKEKSLRCIELPLVKHCHAKHLSPSLNQNPCPHCRNLCSDVSLLILSPSASAFK